MAINEEHVPLAKEEILGWISPLFVSQLRPMMVVELCHYLFLGSRAFFWWLTVRPQGMPAKESSCFRNQH